MEDDQQFCLRWNNHQSTLVAVFDTLLENGTLVDCTLAAEGKYLNAHKVVLSACSPYFESLLSQNYDKHPIFILKDVKYQELKAMMDYMYRGEVNISQDQLGALLKAAESLQIKGLSDNRKGETETKKTVAPPPPPPVSKSPPPTSASIPRVQGLTIEQRRREMEESREGSQSPGARKRKRIRRRSLEDIENHHDASNSSESHHSSSHAPAQNIPTALSAAAAVPIKVAPPSSTDVPEPVESKSEILTRHKPPTAVVAAAAGDPEITQVPTKEKLETHSELMLEPKAEYIDEMNEDSIEDLTLDDDDISNMEQMDDSGAGPSHGNLGEASGQGFGGWHMGNQSQDEVFLAAQEAVGAHRDSQDQKKEEIKVLNISTIYYEKIPIIKQEKILMSTPISEINENVESTGKTAEILEHQYNSKTDNNTQHAFGQLRKERMKRFLAMTKKDVIPKKKVFRCQMDINLFKKPPDTIKCPRCLKLVEISKRSTHTKECFTPEAPRRYACASCSFQHIDIKEIEIHVLNTHRKKDM